MLLSISLLQVIKNKSNLLDIINTQLIIKIYFIYFVQQKNNHFRLLLF